MLPDFVPAGVLQQLRSFDPLAGFMGIMPPGVDRALCWVRVPPVAGASAPTWRKLAPRTCTPHKLPDTCNPYALQPDAPHSCTPVPTADTHHRTPFTLTAWNSTPHADTCHTQHTLTVRDPTQQSPVGPHAAPVTRSMIE